MKNISNIKNKIKNYLISERKLLKNNVLAQILLAVWLSLFLIQSTIFYLNNYSDVVKQLQIQSQEAYQQIGLPEGFVIKTQGGNGAGLAGRYYVKAEASPKPVTKEEKQAQKEKADKYYAEKLAQYGWTKVPGYKYLYQRGDHQWMDIAIYYDGETHIRTSTTLFKDYVAIKDIATKEEKGPY